MKVLHVISAMDPAAGGVTTAVNTMIEGLERNNISSEVVSLDSKDQAYIKRRPFIHGLGPAKTAWSYSSSLLPWLKENMGMYDAVIIHGLWQYHVYAVFRALRKIRGKKPKLLVMPHGMLDPYFQKDPERKLKAIRNRLFWRFVERHTINSADCLLFTCETEKLLSFEPFRPYHPKRTEVSGLGIESAPEQTAAMIDAFERKCGQADVKGCILFISRIHAKKGVDLLIRAYHELKQEGKSLPVLVIAGPGTETEFGNKMKALAGDSGDIIFTGMLAGDEKWGAFYRSSVMILPSHQENFGFVVVEALACEKPVIISNQVNIWREVAAGKGGIVGDDTKEGIKRMLQEWTGLTEPERMDMGKRARETYEKYFSLSEATKKLSGILDDVCRSR